MPRLSGPSHDDAPEFDPAQRRTLEEELAALQAKVRGLEAQLSGLPPAARSNTEAEIGRLKARIAEIRRILGR
jgi:hypothetical protein